MCELVREKKEFYNLLIEYVEDEEIDGISYINSQKISDDKENLKNYEKSS